MAPVRPGTKICLMTECVIDSVKKLKSKRYKLLGLEPCFTAADIVDTKNMPKQEKEV